MKRGQIVRVAVLVADEQYSCSVQPCNCWFIYWSQEKKISNILPLARSKCFPRVENVEWCAQHISSIHLDYGECRLTSTAPQWLYCVQTNGSILGKLHSKEDDDGCKCNACTESSRDDVVVAHPTLEVVATHEPLECKASENILEGN